jgi:hypothetical protein
MLFKLTEGYRGLNPVKKFLIVIVQSLSGLSSSGKKELKY